MWRSGQQPLLGTGEKGSVGVFLLRRRPQMLSKLVQLIAHNKQRSAPLQWRQMPGSFVFWPMVPEGSGPGPQVYAAAGLLQENAFSAAAQILQASTSAGVSLTDSQHARKRLPKLLAAVPALDDSSSSSSESESDDEDSGGIDDTEFARVRRVPRWGTAHTGSAAGVTGSEEAYFDTDTESDAELGEPVLQDAEQPEEVRCAGRCHWMTGAVNKKHNQQEVMQG